VRAPSLAMKCDMTTVAYMAFNFVSSIGIIFVNKLIFKQYAFKFATFVTTLHFFFTCLGLVVARVAGLYVPKKLSHAQVAPISFAFCMHVVFNNLSLQYNSVGFYQLIKVLTSPMIAFIQERYFGVPLPMPLKLTLVLECIGVAIGTVSDVEINLVGFVFAVLGLLGATYYQIFVKTKQKALDANSFQVLHYQAPQSMVAVACMIPLFDTLHGTGGLFDKISKMSFELGMAIVIGSSLAFCVNLSVFLVIGRTSPITYNVLGHFKLVFVLAGGILLFGGDANPKRLFGMGLTFAGVLA
jgi:solute carrier family 35, member E3